jgi:transposase
MEKSHISKEWLKVFSLLNETQKRLYAAEKSLELGYGGNSEVSRITKLSRTTITQGINELKSPNSSKLLHSKIRKEGGGRKKSEADHKLAKAIEAILDETSAGDPMSRLKWTCKSTRTIAEILRKKGFNISRMGVARILKNQGYSLQSNKKMLSGKDHPDRDSQFKHINRLVSSFSKTNDPIISVDTKKKELVGNFKNNGQVWTKNTIEVFDHDFASYSSGKAIPYGAYDINRNEGFVNIGTSSDTSEFAVNSIWQWWRHFGRKNYPTAQRLFICADGGGSNGSRTRAWKFFLQELANRMGIPITVANYPPGTSKWNKIEHRMFSFISMYWKGKPLENYEAVVKLISATTTKSGLKIKARVDKKEYEKNIKITDDEFEEINLKFSNKFPKWNYTILPF